MKKTIIISAFAAVVFAACTKAEFRAPEKADGLKGNFSVSATLENDDAQDSRTSLDANGKSVLWSVGDKISLLWNGGSAESSEVDVAGATASFTATVEDTPEYAVYPSSATASWDGSELSVCIPSTQDGSFASAAIAVAQIPVANGEGNRTLAFKNLAGLLKLSFNDDEVSTVSITAYGDKTIAGTATVEFENGLPVVKSVSGGASGIVLDGLTGTGARTYYAAVLPASLSDGIYIELKKSDGTVKGQKFSGKKLSVARRKIVSLGSIAVETINGTFVKVNGNGSGDGSDWDNAMSWADFDTKIKATNGISGKIFMAGGTYNSTATAGSTLKSSISVFGGYDPASSGTDLSKRNTELYPTEFDGMGTSRIFVWSTSSLTASFDGVTFKNAYRKYTDIGSAIVLNSYSSASFNNCKILNCVKIGTASVSSNGGGGAVRIGAGTAVFKNCYFSGNHVLNDEASKSGYGGVLAYSSNSAAANLTLDDCVFDGNYNAFASGKGGVLYLYSTNATATITNCTFSNNTTAVDGGVICLSAGTLNITNSTFSNNSATNSGGVVTITGGTLNIDGSTFSGNSAVNGGVAVATGGTIVSRGNTYSSNTTSGTGNTKGGGVYRIDGAVNLDLFDDKFESNTSYTSANNGSAAAIMANSGAYVVRAHKCLFLSNKSGSRGTVRSFTKDGKLYLNACSFYNNIVTSYGAAVHSNGPCCIHNCAFHLNNNEAATSPSTICVGASSTLVSNSCIRMYGMSGAGLESFNGTATIVNNTIVNSAESDEATKAVAIRATKAITSYGHNIYSKLEDSGSLYSLQDASHTDVQALIPQVWIGSPYYLVKSDEWAAGNPRPTGFSDAEPSRVVDAIEAFDSANGTSFKDWLQSDDLKINGKTALEYDIRGIARSTTAIWPGSYDNSASASLP